MAMRRTPIKAIPFEIVVRGVVKATTLEEAEQVLDFAHDDKAWRERGITVTGRDSKVGEHG